MWFAQKGITDRKEDGNGLVAVAIGKDKGSQYALKWAVDHILNRGQTVILVHVKLRSTQSLPGTPVFGRGSDANFENVVTLTKSQIDQQTKELFLPFRCFCTRRDILFQDIVLEDDDVANALIEYVSHSAIETLVIGATGKSGFLKKFMTTDISSSVSKGVPDFCTVYVINKGKISSVRSASRPAPTISPLRTQIQNQPTTIRSEPPDPHLSHSNSSRSDMSAMEPRLSVDEIDFIKSPFTRRGRLSNGKHSPEYNTSRFALGLLIGVAIGLATASFSGDCRKFFNGARGLAVDNSSTCKAAW